LSTSELVFVDYQPEYGLETVKMWRRSFQQAMGIEVHNRLDELNGHLEYLKSIDSEAIRIVLDPELTAVVGLMNFSDGELHHLFVHVDYQGRGIGSTLLQEAKALAPQGFDLFTFVSNTVAQAFYLSHGFDEIERGFADLETNPWASSKAELADIKYRWSP